MAELIEALAESGVGLRALAACIRAAATVITEATRDRAAPAPARMPAVVRVSVKLSLVRGKAVKA